MTASYDGGCVVNKAQHEIQDPLISGGAIVQGGDVTNGARGLRRPELTYIGLTVRNASSG